MARQATGSVLSDVGDIYKRLLNHRPVIQNEVYYFVREFEFKREDSGLKNLQDAMKYANEMDSLFLEEIKSSSHYFKQIAARIETINAIGNEILEGESKNLNIPSTEQEEMDKHVEKCRKQFQNRQELYDTDHSNLLEQLKEEIRIECEAREKLCSSSRTVSAGSSSSSFHLETSSSKDSSVISCASPDQEETMTTQEMKSEIKDGSTEEDNSILSKSTNDPTESGTSDPTESGTGDPTESGTSDPTESGISDPTESGTSDPTESGTSDPTESGTSDPTERGTSDPTESGTSDPTESGTGDCLVTDQHV